MKQFSKFAGLLTALLFAGSALPLRAADYHISLNGTSGTITLDAFQQVLAGISSPTSDRTVNAYFAAGTYNLSTLTASNKYFILATSAANAAGLQVTFQPESGLTAADVVFDGGTSSNLIRFIEAQGNGTLVTLKKMTFQNFTSTTSASETGASSLFDAANNTTATLTVDSCIISNITSRENPLGVVGGAANVLNFEHCVISNLHSTQYGIFDNGEAGGGGTLTIDHCQLSGLQSTDGVYGSTFRMVDDGGITFNLTNSSITGINSPAYFLRIGNSNDKVTMDHDTISGTNVTSKYFIYVDVAATSSFTNNVIQSVNSQDDLFYFTNGTNEVSNNLIQSNTVAGDIVYANGGTTHISGNTISGNTATPYIINSTTGTNYIDGNSFYQNTLTSGNKSILAITGGTYTYVYNNTIDNNTASYSLYCSSSKAAVFNNLFRSTGLYFSSASNTPEMINNIFSGITIPSGAAAYMQRNIIDSGTSVSLFATGITAGTGTDITTAYTSQFDNALQITNAPYNAAGHQVYDFRNPVNDEAPVILRQGGTLAGLSTELGFDVTQMLKYDQLGRPRPGNISIGPVDLPTFDCMPTLQSFSDLYDSNGTTTGMPTSPQTVSGDLANSFAGWPVGVSTANATFTLSPNPTTLSNGSFGIAAAPNTNIATYDPPTSNMHNVADTVTLNVSGTDTYGFQHARSFKVQTYIYDMAQWKAPAGPPPGYTDPSQYPNTCFAYMPTIKFTSDYRWRTGHANTDPGRVAWSSTVLVGDLNGDGYPEVVALGIGTSTSTTTASTGGWTGIVIYNGQTGAEIARLPFKVNGTGAAMTFTHTGWHTATPMSLVDSDRDGTVELIIAFPNGGSGTGISAYEDRLVSYLLKWDATNKTYSLVENPKWLAYQGSNGWPQYNTGFTADEKGVPQICDFDGDGNPEVLVYNKIYSAVTGQLLLTMEDMSTAYMGLNKNANDVGNNDKVIPLDAIYDMDGDGVYDVVAGGKIYYIHGGGTSFSYTIEKEDDVPDGFTTVADVDGDGIPDVVSVAQTTTGASGNLMISVWNPQKGLIAQRTVAVTGRTYGSNSYVYVGDIDGRKQTWNGKDYYLPEIAVLTGDITFGDNFPLHPNVANIPVADGGIPTSGTSSGHGVLMGWTIDLSANTPADKLKGSFVLEHDDDSNDTGFTMFDFDNDGVKELCYRDNSTLRIIKPIIPYVKLAYVNSGSTTPANNRPDVILLSTNCGSTTGFEYPVIADIDKDASAEIVVPGCDATGNVYYSFVYAIGNGSGGDKFAPALPVWNQFMYDPFKINPDLTTPRKTDPNFDLNRLDPQYTYTKVLHRGEANETTMPYNPYNGNMVQLPDYTLTTAPDEGKYGPVFEPIVFLSEAYLVSNTDADATRRPAIVTVGNTSYAEFIIGDKASAQTSISGLTPIAMYQDNKVSKGTWVKTVIVDSLVNVATSSSLKTAIQPGQEYRVRIPVPDPEGVYLIRLGDNSFDPQTHAFTAWSWGLNSLNDGAPDADQGIGVAATAYRDCDWSDQLIRAAKPNLFPDLASVQAYQSVAIPVFDNDILPDDYFSNTTNPWKVETNTAATTLNSFTLLTQPVEGTLTLMGSKKNLKVLYKSNGADQLTSAVDSFRYRAIFTDPENSSQTLTKQTTVYVYVLQNRGAYATCAGGLNVQLKQQPTGVVFNWYKADSTSFLQTGASRYIDFSQTTTADSVYMIEPKVTAAFAADSLQGYYFPKGRMVFKKTLSGAAEQMRWTGDANSDWNNPDNWVQVLADGSEMPVTYVPTPCTNVTISSGVDNYPELVDSAYCHDIDMQDRAMLKNPHVLNYDSARVEFKLKPSERDRYLMWSAPMLDMVAGDYHFDNPATGDPEWGDFQLSIFMGYANSFSSSQALVGAFLPLGKAFNLKLTTTSQNADSVLWFPKPNTEYVGSDGNKISFTGTYKRINLARFVTDEMEPDGKGDYLVPVQYFSAQITNGTLLQVVNPYFAYLNFDDFYQANKDSIQSGYYLWDGKTDDGFVGVVASGSSRYLISSSKTDFLKTSPNQIPPLQSFIVAKNTNIGSAVVHDMRYSPAFTSTKPSASYTLRAADVLSGGLLQIGLTEGTASASAALVYDLSASSGLDSHDLPLATSDAMPLALSTLVNGQTPLLMNSSNDFSSAVLPLALSAKSAGEATLTFTGLSDFGYDVYLTDKTKGKETQLTPSSNTYTFTLSKSGSMTDRFSLRFVYTGQGVVTGTTEPEADATSLRATALTNGGFEVRGLHPGTMLYVYDAGGRLMYQKKVTDVQWTVPDLQINGLYVLVNDGRSVKARL